MANSENTTWIVSCTKWTVDRGEIEVDHCYGRAYRRESYARDKYNAIVDSLREKGYEIQKIHVPMNEEYEGIRARFFIGGNSQRLVRHAIVYIDRNPVWNPS